MNRLVAIAAMAVLGASGAASGAWCTAASGERTAALVELYTSEGCDSCPPADRWLSSLQTGYAPERVVPLALHVDYWNYLGWNDPYARREFSTRQRRLAELKRAKAVYTPQVLLQGQDFLRWGTKEFDAAVVRINGVAARARLELRLEAAGTRTLEVVFRAQLLDGSHIRDSVAYLAAYENRLVSDVGSGENRGKALRHDFVVRQWAGPFAFPAGGALVLKTSLALLPTAKPGDSGVAAFVQNRATGDVLQALMRPPCPG
ncbi:MAG: DUF1223 domain-containing protein [Betaproteobacteria bacterium]|nr:DUF1223 domain-containing protein [Betaproteobacteria bacterium]